MIRYFLRYLNSELGERKLSVILVSATGRGAKTSEQASGVTGAAKSLMRSRDARFIHRARNGRGRLINNNLSTRALARPCPPALGPPAFH